MLKGALPLRKIYNTATASAICKTSLYVLMEIYLQLSKRLGPYNLSFLTDLNLDLNT